MFNDELFSTKLSHFPSIMSNGELFKNNQLQELLPFLRIFLVFHIFLHVISIEEQ